MSPPTRTQNNIDLLVVTDCTTVSDLLDFVDFVNLSHIALLFRSYKINPLTFKSDKILKYLLQLVAFVKKIQEEIGTPFVL